MAELPPVCGRIAVEDLETVAVLRKLSTTSRALAELKGGAVTIPQPEILINTLAMQEAKDSSEIENIVTTHDELFREDAFPESPSNPAAKEVRRYAQALRSGYRLVRETGLLTTNHIVAVQRELEQNTAGLRKIPGTNLQDGAGNVVYTPPQEHQEIISLMGDLERLINDPDVLPTDPLIRMAVIHHQFESIHPFYDGNGRTGRIINVLFLVKEGLLDLPVLYLSRAIVRTKADYYRLLQSVRREETWEPWLLYMLEAVEQTARDTLETVQDISHALMDYKHRIRDSHNFYSQELLNNLFTHPYTKIAFVEQDLGVSRVTAAKYLDTLAEEGLLRKERAGRSNYYVNPALERILSRSPG